MRPSIKAYVFRPSGSLLSLASRPHTAVCNKESPIRLNKPKDHLRVLFLQLHVAGLELDATKEFKQRERVFFYCSSILAPEYKAEMAAKPHDKTQRDIKLLYILIGNLANKSYEPDIKKKM